MERVRCESLSGLALREEPAVMRERGSFTPTISAAQIWVSAAQIGVSAALIGMLAACGGNPDGVRIAVRTTLPEALTSFVEASFEAANPDVDVRFSRAPASTSLEELGTADADHARFDVWWGAPAIALERAARAGLLLRNRPSWFESDPNGGASSGEYWQPLLETPFVIAFNRDSVQLSRAPTDWIDLFHARWTEDVVLLDPVRTEEGAAFVGVKAIESLREYGDPLAGFDWLARLDRQVRLYAGDVDEAIGLLDAGRVRLGVLPRAAIETARSLGHESLYYRLPETPGPALLLGVAVIARPVLRPGGGSGDDAVGPDAMDRALDAARRFVEFVGSAEVATQSWRVTHWQPTQGGDPSALPPDLELGGRWEPVALAVDTLAAEVDGWVDEWEVQVRRR